MAVKYRRWDADDRVSAQWYAVLSAAKAAGVSFLVTDGHRTMAEQQDRFDHYQRFGSPVAARPSPTAPHIRTGRPDHAIDVNALDGGAARLAAWLRKHGAAASFPVPDEAWHIEVPRDDLELLAGKLADPLAGYPAKERQWIRAYDALVRLKDAGQDPADGRDRRARLRALMTDRRKAIWRAAQRSGWHHLKRRARYRSLLARTANP
jgi:hypothetical protein